MFGIGVPELIIILVVVLLIFGPKNLPKLGESLGKTVKNVRKGMQDTDDKDQKEPAAKAEAKAEDTSEKDE